MKFRSTAILFTTMLLSAQLSAKELTPAELKKMQAAISQSDSLSVHFRQVRVIKNGKRELRSRGEAQLDRTGKFRWSHSEPNKNVMIFNGTTLIQFQPEDKQATRYRANAMMARDIKEVVDLVLNFDRFLDRYTVEKAVQDGARVSIELRPKESQSTIKEVVLGIAVTEKFVDHVELRYADGNKSTWTFTDPRTEKLPESIFAFTPPPGVVINDIN